MHKVSCSACGQIVEITPDAALCSACGTDLIEMIPAEGTPQHYYARAERYIDQNDIESALLVVQDGLESVVSSDLLLLGAILSEKVGKYDLMRHYVSRIPVDDSLRVEGEWLLRAHQARQRAQRQGRDPSQAILEEMSDRFGLPPETESHESLEIGWDYAPEVGAPIAQRGVARVALPVLVVIGLIGFGWIYRGQLLAQSWIPTALRTAPEVEVMSPAILPEEPIQNAPGDANDNLIEPPANSGNENNSELNFDGGGGNTTGNVGPTQAPVEGGLIGDLPVEPTAVPTPTVSADVLIRQPPSATDNGEQSPEQLAPVPETPEQLGPEESIPDDLTESATPEPLAAADPQKAVNALAQETFDVLRYLREFGRSDLADLPLDAQVEDGKLIVTGVVKWYEEREAIIEALQFAPNVSEVNAIGLKTRTPETYTVQEADTLWVIAFRIYGDGARWPQIYELNQDALLSPDTLGLGQVLKIPPQ